MFSNLIESSSHTSEFKRRGTFFLCTTATYVLLFVIAGVMSIYAYDARLEDQNTEIITMLNPVDLPAAPVTPVHTTPNPGRDQGRQADVVRENPMASVNHPENAPELTSATPNASLPVPDHGTWRIGDHDSGPIEPGVSGRPGNRVNGPVSGGTPNVDVGTPPSAPAPKPLPKVISKGVITSQAISLPKPPYPPIARQLHIQGMVSVQVLIDETGKVISAKAVSGNPSLVSAAQAAAFQARFSPTFLGEQRVKVSGVITYNFVLQ